MARLLLLFNHTLTQDQQDAATRELGITRIITPPLPLRQLWSNIPPDAEALLPLLAPLSAWLKDVGEEGDYILIQGDFGACFLLVNQALRLGLAPVYSTTSRQAVEVRLDDGRVRLEHTFKHVRFRHYGQ
jgi:hypothetical protein